MIKEYFVSFEAAKLLKDKGFNEETSYVYSDSGELLRLTEFGVRDLTNVDCNGYSMWQFQMDYVLSIISAPSLQRTTEWLRVNHNLVCSVKPYVTTEGFFYAYKVYFLDNERLGCFIKDKRAQFASPAEATRAAVKYCLENLI